MRNLLENIRAVDGRPQEHHVALRGGVVYPGAGQAPMALLSGDLPGIEKVELDSAGDVGDAGLAGFSGGEVAGLLGFAGAAPVRPGSDGEAGHEDLEQERGERML